MEREKNPAEERHPGPPFREQARASGPPDITLNAAARRPRSRLKKLKERATAAGIAMGYNMATFWAGHATLQLVIYRQNKAMTKEPTAVRPRRPQGPPWGVFLFPLAAPPLLRKGPAALIRELAALWASRP